MIQNNVSTILGQLRWGISDLARAMGVTHYTASRLYHADRGGLSLETMSKLCGAFRRPLCEIFTYIPPDGQPLPDSFPHCHLEMDFAKGVTLYNNVPALMEERGWGIPDLAHAMWTTYQTAARLYHGTWKGIGFDKLDKLCETFQRPLCCIFICTSDPSTLPHPLPAIEIASMVEITKNLKEGSK